jgi:glycosyltransferase involved in cell wall biosynthesis
MTTPSDCRVLVVVEQLRREVPGGIGTYARGILQGLTDGADRAVPGATPLDVSLYASRHRGRGADPLERLGRPLATSRLPGPLLVRAWDRGRCPVPEGFDVVHATSLAIPPMAHGHPAKLTVTVHDLTWRTHPEATTRRGRRWHEANLQRALRDAQAFVVPSDMVATQLVEAGAADHAVTVVAGGTDHMPAPDRAGASRLLRDMGVAESFILSVGTAEPRKNLGRLFRAYDRVRRRLPEPWPLVVVGPTGWGDAGTDRPPPGVFLVGHVDDDVLAGMYALSRAFVYVPLTEGYGLPPLEAMTFGVPVVASTTVPSVVPHATEPPDEAALRVDALDVDAIADALLTACADVERRLALADAGQRLARGRTWRRAAELHAKVWRDLVAEGPGTR